VLTLVCVWLVTTTSFLIFSFVGGLCVYSFFSKKRVFSFFFFSFWIPTLPTQKVNSIQIQIQIQFNSSLIQFLFDSDSIPILIIIHFPLTFSFSLCFFFVCFSFGFLNHLLPTQKVTSIQIQIQFNPLMFFFSFFFQFFFFHFFFIIFFQKFFLNALSLCSLNAMK